MLTLKFLFESLGFALFVSTGVVLGHDLYQIYYKKMEAHPIRWPFAAKLAGWAMLPLLIGMSIQVVPDGMAGVRVSQISGTLPGTLYPGLHVVLPLMQRVDLFDIRDHVFRTSGADDPKQATETLMVQTKEGLAVGLAVSVRYRLDPQRLPYIQANLPQPVDKEIVPSVVAAAFRELAPNYLVRDVFAGKREEIRRSAADTITRKLASDAIVVKEVMVRDIVLPEEYAKSLEGTLLKEQENDRLTIELDVKLKQVRAAELEAEAEKTRHVKAAEGEAQIVVLQAKAQADAMQYTLPLKEKQIQQTRLEAEARKESTVKQAEAMGEAKVIDGKAELERRKMMNLAEADRIEIMAKADGTRMRLEASVLKDNPLLIQKIIAERLSDKVQIMMVPNDGKFFFANDVLKGATQAALNTGHSAEPNSQ